MILSAFAIVDLLDHYFHKLGTISDFSKREAIGVVNILLRTCNFCGAEPKGPARDESCCKRTSLFVIWRDGCNIARSCHMTGNAGIMRHLLGILFWHTWRAIRSIP